MKSNVMLTLTKGLLEAQKSIDELKAEDICAVIDIAAAFIDQNVDKLMDVSTKIVEHVVTSEHLREVAVHVVSTTVKNVEILSNNKDFTNSVESMEQALEDAYECAVMSTRDTDSIKKTAEFDEEQIKERTARVEKAKLDGLDPDAYQHLVDRISMHQHNLNLINNELAARKAK